MRPSFMTREAVAGLADLGQVVAGKKDGVLTAKALYELAHLDDLHRIQAAGRLIQDEQRRFVHERLRQTGTLAVPCDRAPMS